MYKLQVVKPIRLAILFSLFLNFNSFAIAQDDDPNLPPITIVGSPLPGTIWDLTQFTNDGGSFNPFPTGSGDGGSGSPGIIPGNPRSTPGESNDCPVEETMRIARASEQIRAAVGALGCVQQRHRNRFWEVNFPDGKSGVYLGIGDCRSSLNNAEIINPGC